MNKNCELKKNFFSFYFVVGDLSTSKVTPTKWPPNYRIWTSAEWIYCKNFRCRSAFDLDCGNRTILTLARTTENMQTSNICSEFRAHLTLWAIPFVQRICVIIYKQCSKIVNVFIFETPSFDCRFLYSSHLIESGFSSQVFNDLLQFLLDVYIFQERYAFNVPYISHPMKVANVLSLFTSLPFV